MQVVDISSRASLHRVSETSEKDLKSDRNACLFPRLIAMCERVTLLPAHLGVLLVVLPSMACRGHLLLVLSPE